MVHLRHDRERMPGRWPIATVSVLAVTAVLTVLQFPFPQVRLDLWRDPDALAAGQWWRLVTPLLVGFGLGALLLWRDRRRHPDDRVVAEAGPAPRS